MALRKKERCHASSALEKFQNQRPEAEKPLTILSTFAVLTVIKNGEMPPHNRNRHLVRDILRCRILALSPSSVTCLFP